MKKVVAIWTGFIFVVVGLTVLGTALWGWSPSTGTKSWLTYAAIGAVTLIGEVILQTAEAMTKGERWFVRILPWVTIIGVFIWSELKHA